MEVKQLKEIFKDKMDYQIKMSNYKYDYSMEQINKEEFRNFHNGYIVTGDGFRFDIDWNDAHHACVQDFYDLLEEENIQDDEPFISWDEDDGNVIDFDYCICNDKYKIFVLIS